MDMDGGGNGPCVAPPKPNGAQQGPSLEPESAPAHKKGGNKERSHQANKKVKKYLEATDNPTACKHNRWTLQAKKKRFYLFRCIVCNKLWKTKFRTTQKCVDFFVGHCPLGDACPHPHIYSKNRKGVNIKTSLESFRAILGGNNDPTGEDEHDDESDVDEDNDILPAMSNFELGNIVSAALGESDSLPGSDSPSAPVQMSPRPPSPSHVRADGFVPADKLLAEESAATTTQLKSNMPAYVQTYPQNSGYILTPIQAQPVQQPVQNTVGASGYNIMPAPQVNYTLAPAPATNMAAGCYTLAYPAQTLYSYAPAGLPLQSMPQGGQASLLGGYNLDDNTQKASSGSSSVPATSTSQSTPSTPSPITGYNLDTPSTPSQLAYSIPVYAPPSGVQAQIPLSANGYELEGSVPVSTQPVQAAFTHTPASAPANAPTMGYSL